MIDEVGREISNYESLSMILIDNNFTGNFIMQDYYFAKDLIHSKKTKLKENEDTTDEIRNNLKNASLIRIPINNAGNSKVMAIYIDIYGNEFKETFELGV
jgi:site-specific DNA-methyltransferase (adenine-specific)/adenine-specific DNA-methyltransferase